LSDDNSEQLELLREIRDLLRPVADHYQKDYDLRQQVRAIVNSSPPRRKAWDLLDGVLVQRDIYEQAGMDQGNLSKYLKALRQLGAISGDPPTRTMEV
jgi:hypothetical protein